MTAAHPTLRVLARRINAAEDLSADLVAACAQAMKSLTSPGGGKDEAVAILERALRQATRYSAGR